MSKPNVIYVQNMRDRRRCARRAHRRHRQRGARIGSGGEEEVCVRTVTRGAEEDEDADEDEDEAGGGGGGKPAGRAGKRVW